MKEISFLPSSNPDGGTCPGFPRIADLFRRVHGRKMLVLLCLSTTPAIAQIRGRPAPRANQVWWFSGGASAAVINNISDGATQSTWQFGSDPRWQARMSLEKAMDEYTTMGVAIGYGPVDVTLSPLVPGTPIGGNDSGACSSGCSAETELWSAMAQFRSGGGPGFHTLFEAQGGVVLFRNLRTRDTHEPIGPGGIRHDLAGTLGAGFGYTLSPGFAVTIIQDFGIGWHSSANLPDGTGRTWRMRATRASLRFAL